jgi:hypothetical protein
MTVSINAQGFMGLAFETTAGTYVPPTQFFPIRSETLQYKPTNQRRRVIRGIADDMGPIKGWSNIEGDVEMELMERVLPYWLYCSRNTVAKTGAGPNYTYTTTPLHNAVGAQVAGKVALSLTVVRGTTVFGYTGCLVNTMEFSTDNGITLVKFGIVGLDEAVQTSPTFAYNVVDIPFNAGQYNIQIPTSSQIFDCDKFTVTIEDGLVPANMLSSTTTPAYLRYGERVVKASLDRDFNDRTEYDAFKALTQTSLAIACSKGANNSVTITLPKVDRDTYNLSGLTAQADLHRATIDFIGAYDTVTSKAYAIAVVCQENIV